jgi:hypothetical protein
MPLKQPLYPLPAVGFNRFDDGQPLAYLQTKHGFTVKIDMPGLRGLAIDKLYFEEKAKLTENGGK